MQTDDVIDLARHLIAIDSVNPTLVPGGAGEHEIAQFVAGWATEYGLASRTIPSPDGRPNLVIGDARRVPAAREPQRHRPSCSTATSTPSGRGR